MEQRRSIDPDIVRSLVLEALRAGAGPEFEASGLVACDPAIIVRLPAWVTRVGVLQGPEGWWLYVERAAAGDARAPDAGGQILMDVPPGRYAVETFDPSAGEWVGLESAAGGPLVAGLLCRGDAVILRIRRLADLS